MSAMSAPICWILLAAAAAGQTEPAANVELDPAEFGLNAVADREELQFEDREAYYRILEQLQHVDPQALARAAADHRHQRWSEVHDYGEFTEDEFPVFVDLFLHPEEYRGRPVTLRGHLVDPVIRLPQEDGSGFDQLYEAHLYDADSQGNPATVIFTDLPRGIDLEAEMIDGVSVSGYFLKIHRYRSRGGKQQLAPLILARTIEVGTPAPPEWPVAAGAVIALIVVVAIVALVVVLIVSRKDRGVMSEYRRRFETRPQFDASEIEPSEIEEQQ